MLASFGSIAFENNPMDTLITIIRFPLGLLRTLALILVGWPAELVLGLCMFPVKASIWSREELKMRYGNWPCNTLSSISGVWHWVYRDEVEPTGPDMKGGKGRSYGLGQFWSNLLEQ
jgi:hypothetical protein